MARFSERMGLRPIKDMIQRDSMDDDLRNALWSLIYTCYFKALGHRNAVSDYGSLERLATALWMSFFKLPLDQIPWGVSDLEKGLRSWFFDEADYLEVYDFVEFIGEHGHVEHFPEICNVMLERERSAYRFIEKQLTPITSEEELATIERAMSETTGKLAVVHTHLRSSLEMLADRRQPDYRNSIKESVSAVEALVNLINGSKGTTLGQALKKLDPEPHGALKAGFLSLYGWTSDDSGIRHALIDEPTVGLPEAQFMLSACSAFISYLLARAAGAGLDLSK
jgi:hypothetical protein